MPLVLKSLLTPSFTPKTKSVLQGFEDRSCKSTALRQLYDLHGLVLFTYLAFIQLFFSYNGTVPN